MRSIQTSVPGEGPRHGRWGARRVLASLCFGLLVAVVLTGCAGGGSDAVLPDDGPPPSRSAEAALRLLSKSAAAGQAAAQTGRLELVVTEEEVNSVLDVGGVLGGQSGVLPADQLDAFLDRAEAEGQDTAQLRDLLNLGDRAGGEGGGLTRLRPRVVEPSVYFRGNGRMIIRGKISWLFLQLPIRAVAAPRAAGGELELDFVEGQVGGVPMPELVFDLLGRGVAEAVMFGQAYAQITEISVGAGTLTLRGQVEP